VKPERVKQHVRATVHWQMADASRMDPEVRHALSCFAAL
jgi:hypothetical protein